MDHPKVKLTRDSITTILQLLTNDEDEQLKLDTLEGETDLFELVGEMIDRIEELDGMRQALVEQANARVLKAERLKQRSQAIKDTIQSLLETAGVPKIPLPQATVYVSNRPGGWKVVDETKLTEEFIRTETVTKPDKERIASAIEHGIVPDGVLRTNGGPVLNIRRK